MWYRADLLFATPPREGEATVQCETCNVLIEGETHREAYDKALLWAAEHVRELAVRFVGVEGLSELDEERPGDGTEVGGMYYEDENVWERVDELIPPRERLAAFFSESEAYDRSLIESLGPEKAEALRRIVGS
jgi:hypothetical protein